MQSTRHDRGQAVVLLLAVVVMAALAVVAVGLFSRRIVDRGRAQTAADAAALAAIRWSAGGSAAGRRQWWPVDRLRAVGRRGDGRRRGRRRAGTAGQPTGRSPRSPAIDGGLRCRWRLSVPTLLRVDSGVPQTSKRDGSRAGGGGVAKQRRRAPARCCQVQRQRFAATGPRRSTHGGPDVRPRGTSVPARPCGVDLERWSRTSPSTARPAASMRRSTSPSPCHSPATRLAPDRRHRSHEPRRGRFRSC